MVRKGLNEPVPVNPDLVKVKCNSCSATGAMSAVEYATNKKIIIECSQCNGDGYHEEYIFKRKENV